MAALDEDRTTTTTVELSGAGASEPSGQPADRSGAEPGSAEYEVSLGDLPTDGPFSHIPLIDGYLVEGALGHGGMAEVYKAQRLGAAGVSVPCVIKMILPAKANDPAFRDKFLAEARIHAKMRHPNLVQVLDVGRAEDRLYLAIQWVDGLDAANLIRSARRRKVGIPLRHVLFILKETLQGLHHTHTHGGTGFVHRDISPANILISRQGAVKLADFGVARSVEEIAADQRRTLAGKLHYFAPELVTGEAQASAQTDVFALGVTFWEMLTCAPLFSRRKRWPQLRSEIATFDVERLIEDELTLPEGIEDILRRCLGARNARYLSALEFLEDVNDYAYEAGLRLLDAHFADYVARTLELDEGHGDTLAARIAAESTA